MGKIVKHPTAVNYRNKDEVIAHAKTLKHQRSVIKFPNRETYTIIHTISENLVKQAYGDFEVVYRTKK